MNPERDKPDKPMPCNYKGIKRFVGTDVCLWHLERKDPECEKCEEVKKLKAQG